jgi:hypothetical protein
MPERGRPRRARAAGGGIRYWSRRLAALGSWLRRIRRPFVRIEITLLDDQGHERRYRIVGERSRTCDGHLPIMLLAQSLIGCGIEGTASISGHEFEIVQFISPFAENAWAQDPSGWSSVTSGECFEALELYLNARPPRPTGAMNTAMSRPGSPRQLGSKRRAACRRTARR